MARIVVIEDNPQILRMVKKLLTKANFEVATFATGEAGLLQILELTPDLLLIDLGLPDIDGQTVIAFIRQQPSLASMPIIVFTAWPADTAAKMAQAYGCDGVINKPIDTRRFVEQINNFLVPQGTRAE
jgi:DNA-binding response OmpR family regulator